MRMTRSCCGPPAFYCFVAWAIAWPGGAAVTHGAEIEVFVQLIDEAKTPAREAGVLTEILVREGQLVRDGELLARVEDSEARYLQRRAQLDVVIARQQAEDDVIVRAAEKAAAVAENDWRRAQRTVDRNPNAISASEVDHLQLTAERASLEVERARRDLAVAQVNLSVKENELEFAGQKLARHQVLAPLAGMVVEVRRRRGEWVQPGDEVLRIVRLDKLRAEGYCEASAARGDWVGRSVQLRVDEAATFPGSVVFVSPEIDPVNGQVRVWAEIENQDLQLSPGQRGVLSLPVTQTTDARAGGTRGKSQAD